MDELSDYTLPVIEFKSCCKTDKQIKLIDSATATDPLPPQIDAVAETHAKCSQETQTETCHTLARNVDERKLANWLQRIYGEVEKELLKGCTPILNSFSNESYLTDITIQPYQKLTVPAATNSQGLGIWLSVYTNNAPALVVTTAAIHDEWCEHVEQTLKIFVPKRNPNGNFVTFNEEKSIPIKACLKTLCTNPFNKNIFAGSTFDGDLYVWQYEQLYHNYSDNRNNIEIKEIYHTTLPYGYAVALDWSGEFTVLTAHSNGIVVQWNLGKNIVKEAEFQIKPPLNASVEICTLLALSFQNFVVGTKDGSVFNCSSSSLSTEKRHFEIVPLKKHLFMTSKLLRTHVNGHNLVISADLSGQVYFHDLRNLDDDADTTVAQIPLPFTSTIACTRDGSIIFSPADDGSLECYRPSTGSQKTIKGALKGKGDYIKSSENGCWLITGLYENEFQIFSIES